MSETPAGDSGTLTVSQLPSGADVGDLEPEHPYLAEINGIVEYGVFVDLNDTVSGLVHESVLEGTYRVGQEIVVTLQEIKEGGDVSFEPVDVDPEAVSVEREAPDGERTDSADLEAAIGERIHLEGTVVQVKQTAGPTIFQVRDEDGIVPCAAFEEAGVRAYPEIAVDDVVRAEGSPERHGDTLQLEVDHLAALEGAEAETVRERLAAALEEQAAPPAIDPLIEWPALADLHEDLREVARLLRQTVLEGRPIRIRHHADVDGMSAAVPVQIAIERLVASVHEDDAATRHLIKRLPSKAPYYEMEDATRDLNHALEDRERHGHQLPLLLMLDNGSTAEDVPAYETLAHYDIPIVTVDHHHPDPEAVGDLLTAHVNPYLHGEDYRITTGMLCVELARLIDPDLTDELRHVPAVAGIADRSKADAMADYLELAAEAGFEEDRLSDLSEALDYTAFWLRYDAGDRLIRDVFNLDGADEQRHSELVSFLSERSREAVDDQLETARPHVTSESLENGATLHRLDVENHVHRFTFPAPGKTTGELHDRMRRETDGPAITVGYGPDFAVLRSDGVRLDIPEMVSELQAEIPGGGVSGGGHLVVGSIRFVAGKRAAVVEALVEKMAEAEIDEALSSATPLEES